VPVADYDDITSLFELPIRFRTLLPSSSSRPPSSAPSFANRSRLPLLKLSNVAAPCLTKPKPGYDATNMGLTISYSLAAKVEFATDARALVEKLRERAHELPFLEVGEIIEACGDPAAYDPDHLDRNDDSKWLKIQACHLLELNDSYARVAPDHLIAFTIFPGEGCEPANFGLCSYPKETLHQGNWIKTNLHGWRWSSFCKTQYASNPACGGLDNFLRCHVGLVKLLDRAAEIRILGKVSDEGGYFQRRDAAALVTEIDDWNKMIAGAVGTLKDTLQSLGHDSRSFLSEITKYPDFEHLEAEGRTE
jgi:hypothetical protein